MRLAWPPPRHLIASVLISITALALVHLSPPSWQGILSLPALILVFPIPGYLAILSLFPGKSDLSGRRRAFISLASSALLAGLFSFILTATPRGLQIASLATILSLLAVFLTAVAYGRWSNLPRKKRFLLLPKRGLASARPSPRAALAVLLLAACFIAALAFTFAPNLIPSEVPFIKLNDSDISSNQTRSTNFEEKHIDSTWSIVTVSNNTSSNKADINSTKTNTTAILEDKSKAILASGGGGGNGGGAGGSSSSASSHTAAKRPAPQKDSQPEKTASSSPTAASKSVSKIQSNTSVAGKNASSSSLNSSKKDATKYENLTKKLNASLKGNQTSNQTGTQEIALAAKGISPSSTVAANETKAAAIENVTIKLDSNKSSSETANSNQAPVIKALVPDRASPQQLGAAIFWRAEATDAEGDKILYRFLLNGREASKWSKTSSWSWLSQGLPAGDYLITVQAIDDKHATQDSFDSVMNASFTLSRPNQAPVLQELKADRISPQGKGSIITWTAGGKDPDNDTIYYKFMKNDEDMTGWSASNTWIWNTSSEKPGDYKIAVLAKDGLHSTRDSFDSSLDGTFALTLPNSIPEVTELKSDRSGPQATGSIITWTAIAVDPDGDEISYKFLANDKEVREWSPSNSWAWDTSSATPGEYRIRVLAVDSKHASLDSFDSFKDAAMIITAADTNSPPVLKALVPDIASPQAQGVTVIWKAEAMDPEGDKILYKFQLNGRDMTRWSESAGWKWSSRDLVPGDYKIRVLARDGKHASENSFDSSLDTVFSIVSEIDLQIDQLMKKRSGQSPQQGNYQSKETVTPRKLGG